MIDLRSDTITLPTPAMREAMYRAEVGDDGLGEDPTVNKLEKMAAERMGKAAAIFVASGTMGNLAALLAHCRRGDEVILSDLAHMYRAEAGGMAALGGIYPQPLPTEPDGTIKLGRLEAAIRPDDCHFPPSRLIALENTHARCGGVAIPPAYFAAVREIADRHGLLIHLDGARIFNATVALSNRGAMQDVAPCEITQHVDSVTFCLSKGLSAPVGSLLCGSEDFCYRARRARKMLGGAMRQAGILAAAGIVALEQMVDRLAEDHAHARQLAEGIAAIPGLTIDLERVQTNLFYFDLHRDAKLTAQDVIDRLRELDVLVDYYRGLGIRAVIHCYVNEEGVETALAALRKVMDG